VDSALGADSSPAARRAAARAANRRARPST
jgi:hypothetical protein